MNDRTVPPLPPASQLPVNRPAAGICGRDREFLPAAIEILETPAPPLSVVTMLTICAFFAAALAWSFYGRLDVHAVAPGKIDTAGSVRRQLGFISLNNPIGFFIDRAGGI